MRSREGVRFVSGEDFLRPCDDVFDLLTLRVPRHPQFEVFGPVVPLDAIPVMNGLSRQDGSADYCGHDNDMFQGVAALLGVRVARNKDPNVPVLSACRRAVRAGGDLGSADCVRVVRGAVSMRFMPPRAFLLSTASLLGGQSDRRQPSAPASLLGMRLTQAISTRRPITLRPPARPRRGSPSSVRVLAVLPHGLILGQFASAVSRVVRAAKAESYGRFAAFVGLAGCVAHPSILYGRT